MIGDALEPLLLYAFTFYVKVFIFAICISIMPFFLWLILIIFTEGESVSGTSGD